MVIIPEKTNDRNPRNLENIAAVAFPVLRVRFYDMTNRVQQTANRHSKSKGLMAFGGACVRVLDAAEGVEMLLPGA